MVNLLRGTGYDCGGGIAIDGNGNAWVTGWTQSSGWVSGGFDTSYAGGSDTFVAKINADGTLAWSTYAGGINNEGGAGIAIDGDGNAWVTGWTSSAGWVSGGFNTGFSGTYDVFVMKINANATLAWSSYLGGTGDDDGSGIATDGSGNAWVTGYTGASGWADGGLDTTYGGGIDAFVAKIGDNGSHGNDAVFELLARSAVYNETWQNGQEIVIDGWDTGYHVAAAPFVGSNSFYALGVESDLYGPALVLQGTHQPLDFWEDTDAEGVGYRQFVANWTSGANVQSWLGSLAEPADIVGHSLGGALAQWIASAFTAAGGRVDQVVTFNSPGISSTAANAFVPSSASSVAHYIVNGDVVSMAGRAYLPGNVCMASFSDWNLLDKHLKPLLNPQIGEDVRSAGLTWDMSVTVDALSSPAYCHSDVNYRTWVVGLQVTLNALGAPGLAVVPALLMRRDTTDASRALIGAALRLAKDSFDVAVGVGQQVVLTVGQRAHDLYEATQLTLDSGASLSVSGDPPSLKYQGGLGLDLGKNVSIDLPSWLGGPITADHLLDVVDLDTNGIIDGQGVSLHTTFKVLGGLLTIGGSAGLSFVRGDLTLTGDLNIGHGMVLGQGSLRVGDDLNLVIRGTGDITIPNGAPWIGGLHIGSGSYMLNYTPNLTSSDDFIAVWGSIAGLPALGLQVFFDGGVKLLGAKSISQLETLQAMGAYAGAVDATHPTRTVPAALAAATPFSAAYAVPEGESWAMFELEWENASAGVTLGLTLPDGTVLTEADIAARADMAIVGELSTDHRRVVRVDSPAAGTWAVSVADTTGLGTAQASAFLADALPSVALTGATGGGNRTPVQIGYTASDPDSVAVVSLYYDADGTGYDGTLIVDGLGESAAGTYLWDTASVPAGTYHLYAQIMDGVNAPVLTYLATPVTISDPAAPLEVQGTAGDDAIEVLLAGEQYAVTVNGATTLYSVSSTTTISILSYAGDDTITVGSGVMACTIDGGLGNDSITGGDGSDSIRGDGGNDTIDGGGGDDTIMGNTGDDSIIAGAGADSVMAGLGADTVDGGAGNNTLLGGDGRDSILGGQDNDWIEGRGKMDTIYGGAGNDTIYGGAGSDLIYGEGGDDRIDVGVSAVFHDSVDGGAGSDLIRCDSDDVLTECEGVWPV